MEIAFAFNTIIYLMIFIFPGFLFRKFYFRKELADYYHSNYFEKILWTLFTSLACLALSYFALHILRVACGKQLIPTVTYENCAALMEALAKGGVPNIKELQVNINDYIWYFVGLYTISTTAGISSFSIVKVTGLDSKISVLAFRNYFHYLANRPSDHPLKCYRNVITTVDIKLQYGDETELVSGDLSTYQLENNKLQCIVLKNPYKFLSKNATEAKDILSSIKTGSTEFAVHKEYGDTFIFKKYIPGDFFTVYYEHIVNINFTFVKISDHQVKSLLVRSVHRVVNISLYLALVIDGAIPWLDLRSINVIGAIDKFFFMIFSFLVLGAIVGFINEKLGYRKTTTRWTEFLLSTLLFSVPILRVADIVNTLEMVIALLVVISLIGVDSFLELKQKAANDQTPNKDS